MKVFTCTNFKGLYPVGTAAVIVAHSKAEAKKELLQELKTAGLKQDEDFKPEIQELYLLVPQCEILNNGDY